MNTGRGWFRRSIVLIAIAAGVSGFLAGHTLFAPTPLPPQSIAYAPGPSREQDAFRYRFFYLAGQLHEIRERLYPNALDPNTIVEVQTVTAELQGFPRRLHWDTSMKRALDEQIREWHAAEALSESVAKRDKELRDQAERAVSTLQEELLELCKG